VKQKKKPGPKKSVVSDDEEEEESSSHSKSTRPLPIGKKRITKQLPQKKATTAAAGKKERKVTARQSKSPSPRVNSNSHTRSNSASPVKEKARGRQPGASGKASASSSEAAVYEIDTWLQCDSCAKWRRVSDPHLLKLLKKRKNFFCHALKGLTCRKAEEDHNSYQLIYES
jgi:hypothetical protein